jgi:hypothetical protein
VAPLFAALTFALFGIVLDLDGNLTPRILCGMRGAFVNR